MGILKTAVQIAALKVAEHAVDGVVKISDSYLAKEKALYIYIPASSSDYEGRNYEEVKKEFEGYGFKNVGVLAKHDLIKGWLTKDGSIEEIAINGKTSFRKKSKFRSDAHVLITYHTFKRKK